MDIKCCFEVYKLQCVYWQDGAVPGTLGQVRPRRDGQVPQPE